MKNIMIDVSGNAGIVKPMHAVNNGPVYKFAADQRITNIDSYRAAGIPFARTHDASFCSTYGGEHTVDVHAIFPDFSADPELPESYDFACTDEYMKVINFSGTKVFYRLGSKIEHGVKKYGTLPPPDFRKWAVVCEHIIRHYNEGWADGFHYNIEYWEIWNEPDLDPDDSTHKRTWGGTKAQFFELYDIAATHLKKCFPDLKIGGPAIAYDMKWAEDFLAQLKAPLDFFSWHIYANEPAQVIERAGIIRGMLDKNGFEKTESILNEWNYVRGWIGDEWVYSLRSERSLKGSSFIAATMALSQYSTIDMLMYYDARPSGMNGMFDQNMICDCLKGYYPFLMFNDLYKKGKTLPVSADGKVYAVAAADGNDIAVMLTHYCDNDATAPEEVKITLKGRGTEPTRLGFYLLDAENDMKLVKEELVSGDEVGVYLRLPLFSTYLIKTLPL